MSRSDQPDSTRPTVDAQSRGAVYHPKHIDSEERIYPIPESRLTTLSLLNALVPFFFSLGTGALTFGLGLRADLAMGTFNEEATRFVGILWNICWVLAAVFVIAGAYSLLLRENDIRKLKNAARTEA